MTIAVRAPVSVSLGALVPYLISASCSWPSVRAASSFVRFRRAGAFAFFHLATSFASVLAPAFDEALLCFERADVLTIFVLFHWFVVVNYPLGRAAWKLVDTQNFTDSSVEREETLALM